MFNISQFDWAESIAANQDEIDFMESLLRETQPQRGCPLMSQGAAFFHERGDPAGPAIFPFGDGGQLSDRPILPSGGATPGISWRWASPHDCQSGERRCARKRG